MKYIALLRGINVGGNNRVSMAELKACFEASGFTDVVTYINSGNVLFEADETDKLLLIEICEAAIEKQFGFRVICCVVTSEELVNCVTQAPAWWDTESDTKHNAIFIIPPQTPANIMRSVGDINTTYERVEAVGPIIYWSAPLATFGRTRYNRIVGTDMYKFITIRNANTTKKLAEMCQAK